MNDYRLLALLCLAAAVIIGAAGILIETKEKPPKVRAAGQHTRRGVRRAARAAQRAEDDRTVTWLAELHRRPLRSVRPLSLARARVAGILAVLPARDREPRCGAPGCGRPLDAGCRHITPAHIKEWGTAPGPWDTDEARTELVPLPPMPVDLGDMAHRYAHLIGDPGTRPEIELTIVDPPPGYMDELRALLAGAAALPGPNAAAGNWAPREACPDFDPATDPAGWRHLAYPWADQLVADFDDRAVSR